MLTCPYCGQNAMGHLGKAFLGPARSVKCRGCGKRVSVSWWSVVAAGGAIVLAFTVFSATDNLVAAALVFVVGQVFAMLLHSLWAPIVPREGAVERCRGCGHDVRGVAKGARCPACGGGV